MSHTIKKREKADKELPTKELESGSSIGISKSEIKDKIL